MFLNNRYDTLQKMALIAFAQTMLSAMGDTRKVVRFYPTELIIPTFQQKFMDGVLELEDGTLTNIEFQTGDLDEDFLLRCAQYATNLRVISGRYVETKILSTGLRINSEKIAIISKNFHFAPELFFYSEFDGLEKLINIKNKIKNKEKLSASDHYDLIFIPLMGNADGAEVAVEVFEIVNNQKVFNKHEQILIKKCQYVVADIIADGDRNLFKKFMEKIYMLTMLSGYLEEREDELFEFVRKEAEDDGMKKGMENIARNMKSKSYPYSEISDITGLTIEEIEKL